MHKNACVAVQHTLSLVIDVFTFMNKRLGDREFLAGEYSIADMACFGWIKPYKRQGQEIADFPNLERWFNTLAARPAVEKACAVGEEFRKRPEDLKDDDRAHEILFGKQPV